MSTIFAEGGCDCRAIRYKMLSEPLFTHCCHCRWCQRETGSAFVLNAMIEADRVELSPGAEPFRVPTPSDSGSGQDIYRCPKCFVAVWSEYADPLIRFVRVGTLDDPDVCPPSIHIYTASKQQWVQLPKNGETDTPIREMYYDTQKTWPEKSLKRLNDLMTKSKD